MRSLATAFLVIGLAALGSNTQAAMRHCERCGCRQNCNKVCRLERGTKTEKKTEYSCEHEDFCVPGPSRKCGVTCECDGHGHKRRHVVWQPTCAKVRTRTKLVKKEVSKEVPDYRWVVEEICCGCGCCLGRTEHPAAPSTAGADADSDVWQASATEYVADDDAPADEAGADEQPNDDDTFDRDAPRAESKGPVRFLQSLLGAK
ncbi:MAG TPA: hypothetical protein VGX76_16280 [Pirellulales bacterium]|jgi:hypothetical protein|nr:hypothetical protein [Pirellulales bacterium]